MSPGRDILFVQSTTEIGGAETVLLNLLEASARLRERTVVVTLGFGDGDLPDRLRRLGVAVHQAERARLRHPVRVLRAVRRAATVARAEGTRIVVGNGSHPQVFGSLLARSVSVRSVFYVHGILREPLLRNHPIDIAAMVGKCDLMLANSKASLAVVRRLRPGARAELLYPGTAVRSVLPQDARTARGELGATNGEVLVGTFGRLQRSKGQDVFLRAADQVASGEPRARFAVVGGSTFGLEPEYADDLRALAGSLGIADRTVFTGFRNDVPRLMAACDVICVPSRGSEAFGMVAVEAMAQGKPVVATRTGGPEEIVEDGATGILVPPGDAAALADAVSLLAADSERRRAMGEAGLQRAKEQFSSEVTASHFLEVLDSIK